MKKKKVLILSDHALCTSGVGVQTRHLVEGLLQLFPGEWTFRQFGAAIKHADYETVTVNEDFIIKPIDGFGSPEMLRVALATEKPDVLMLFTDPRFFLWLFEMEDEIHQMCPIVWWHVWDNWPRPEFNDALYDSTDLLNCHSYLTYEICSEVFPEKTNFVPHALPNGIFFPIPEKEISSMKKEILGKNRVDHFIMLWINRNARRKRPNDVLEAWKMFLDKLENKHGHRKATLLMHTEPTDSEGPNLFSVVDLLGIKDNVVFSNERIGFDKMNIMHNISDCCVNIAYAEGFGLTTLESMQTGTPIIAIKTGGLTRQIIDHRDNTENGIALPVEMRSLVGSQSVPYIYEDYVSNETTANAFFKMFEMGPAKRKKLGLKAMKYVEEEFSYQKTIDLWHHTMTKTIEDFNNDYVRWDCTTL